jgi:predicted DCC family thiol-disulfide oxidoreductase YuxK
VRFILDHERDHAIHFASASSATGQRALNLCGLASRPGSIVFVDGNHCFTQSTATLRIARHLRLPWRLLTVLCIIPAPIRDLFYQAIAKNRHKISANMAACRLPTPSESVRFLS